tara:strand:- start:299 stop:1276 length:978 start_codon:yes stop_codon:yes gene_type:complete
MIVLSSTDKKNFINRFPNFELSYEKTLHKKVLTSNLYFIIPKGQKYFVWFTHYKNKQVCLLIKYDRRNKRILNIEAKTCMFNKYLCTGIGTIIYGTYFKSNNICNFSTEDIYFYKHKFVGHLTMDKKFKYLKMLFENLNHNVYSSNELLVSMPIITTNYDECMKICDTIEYPIYAIQQRLLYKRRVYLNEIMKKQENKTYFANIMIRANVINDIYDLYLLTDNSEKFIGHSIISSYKKSVMMNKIFRRIKENDNLDALEESDDEDEFQDVSDDKYVDISKQIVMKCKYSNKHKLWEPIEITNEKCDAFEKINFITKKFSKTKKYC